MSRTHKDRPWKLRYPEQQWQYGHERIQYKRWSESYQYWYTTFCYIERGGVKTKKKRHYVEYHGMPTPMWFIREHMTQPQRTHGKEWERKVVKIPIDDLIDCDPPSVGRKPHIYYW